MYNILYCVIQLLSHVIPLMIHWMIRANTGLPAGARKPHFHPLAHHTSEAWTMESYFWRLLLDVSRFSSHKVSQGS